MNAPGRRSGAGLVLLLTVEDEGWLGQGLGDLEALTARCAEAACRAVLADVPATEIGVTLTNDAAVRALNAEWRGKDKPTNVLSFPLEDLAPGDEPGAMLGDLVLALETLLREAAEEGKSLHDHFCHLLVHGVLHCLGHDHVDGEDAEEMEATEIEILSSLGIADPYADGGLDTTTPEKATARR